MPHFSAEFCDVEPFPGVSCPVSFRCSGTYFTRTRWDIDYVEAPARVGSGWVELPKIHPLYAIAIDYATGDNGYRLIEEEIASEIDSDFDEYQASQDEAVS